jgi:flavin reductase (DIM6/NTAB) family NADH-FMN oxidoreductase RutF
MNTPVTTESRSLRNALGRFATGVCIVTTCTADGRRAALTVNSFCSVSLDPPLVAWYLNDRAPSLPVFREAGYFAIHVLAADQKELASHFARPSDDKFASVSEALETGIGGVPILRHALTRFECRTGAVETYGDHVMFLGQVERYSYGSESPLLFHAGRFMEQGAIA